MPSNFPFAAKKVACLIPMPIEPNALTVIAIPREREITANMPYVRMFAMFENIKINRAPGHGMIPAVAASKGKAAFLIIGFWSYWWINEAFHEGWYYKSFLKNLFLTFVQYLSIPLGFVAVSLISLNYKKIGAGLFCVIGIFSIFFFNSNAGRVLIFIPLLLFAFQIDIIHFYSAHPSHSRCNLIQVIIQTL